MTANDASSTPLSEETVWVAFLKDLDAADDPEQVIRDYAARYPHLEGELRDVAGLQGKLDRAEAPEQPRLEQPARLGDFRIVRPIAEGGMGTIYEAVQEPLGRRVAVKTIRDRRQHLTGTLHARFLREQKVLAQLHHTHIVPIHAAGHDGPLQYFAMSYIDGAALHHVVRTARLREFSSHGHRGHTPTPTLAVLAAEARSSMRNGATGDGNGAPGNGQPRPAAKPSTTTFPNVEPPPVAPEAPAEPPATLAEDGDGNLGLSSEYFRSVARVMIDAAEALQHAHEAGIIHRDLKPPNLMVDTAEHCWVLDFGLAGYLRAQAGGGVPAAGSAGVKPVPDLGPEPDQPSVSGILGTPDYMAPEQLQGRADARTDIWGLGVTLYELLTLRRAFHGPKAIVSSDPRRPRDLVQGLPLDLEAICWKAIRKEPGQRYPSARALAADLRHWLKSEPVQARPAHIARRLALWAMRNKGWAAAIAVTTLAFVAVSLGAIYVSKARADAARAVALVARERLHAAEAEAAAGEALIQQMQRVRLTYQRADWSRGAWDLARRAVAIKNDSRIQAEATSLLAGLDARQVKSFALPGTALAFNPSGKQLLIGGSNRFRRESERPIQIWDSTTYQVHATEINGEGVFGFRADGTPLLLKVPKDEPSRLQLWDVTKAQVLHMFQSPLEGGSTIRGFAVTPDGTLVAASARGLIDKGQPADTGAIAVWEAASGREVFRSATTRATDVALAPDGSLLAAGFEDGLITVWSLPKGEPIATLKADRNTINCLAFGRDPVRRTGPKPPGSGWLLATGDDGAGVIVWDLQTRIPRSICHGPAGSSQVLALAFSPDGMTLASTGRSRVQLWDIASGQFLLNVPAGNYVFALAFSPDGRQLAVGSIAAFGDSESVCVWGLESGRGIDSLRGLLRSVFGSIFSPDSRLVAGLSNDWRVGMWDRSARRLLHILEVTPGSFTDNAAMAFSPDGRRFAFSAGHEASLWNVATGELLKTWKLFEGLTDRLAFPEPNRLLLFRTETETGEVGPFGGVDPVKHPRVCRIRDLLSPEPLKSLAEIRDCNLHIFQSECSPDGKYYVIEGLGGSPDKRTRIANLYEGLTGKKLGALPTQSSIDWGGECFNFNPTGTVLNYYYDNVKGPRTYFLELPSRAVLRQLDGFPGCLGPRAKRWLMSSGGNTDESRSLNLFEQDRHDPLVRFVLDLKGTSWAGNPRFSPDGLYLVWGNPSGSVTVVDLVEVNRRVSELGLGW
jgi:serine/threonine protein kinase/WD40 repeat protein